jgi:hypothetical protein
MHHAPRLEDHFLTRREFLLRCGIGFGALGFAAMVGPNAFADTASGVDVNNPLAPRAPHFPGKAKRVIHIFANGGPSQVDTFDPKPELTKWHGKPLPMDLKTERKTGAAFKSPFTFKKYEAVQHPSVRLHAASGFDGIALRFVVEVAFLIIPMRRLPCREVAAHFEIEGDGDERFAGEFPILRGGSEAGGSTRQSSKDYLAPAELKLLFHEASAARRAVGVGIRGHPVRDS